MSVLLEILGRAITVDTAELIWHWIKALRSGDDESASVGYRQLDEAVALADQRKYDSAEEKLRLYLFENPSCARGRLGAAAICICNNDLEGAIEQLNSVYMRQVSNTMALYALGYCYERLGREAQAAEFYQDCLKFKNYLQLPRQRLAAIFFKNNQLAKTIREYELLKDEYPNDIFNLVTLGYLYIAQGRYESAVKRFNSAILMHPDNFHNEEAEIDQLVFEGQYYEALEAIEDRLEQQGERVDLIVKKGDALGGTGAVAEAICQYEEALRMCPDLLEGTIKLGTQYLKIEKIDEASRLFNRAVEINDQIVDAYIGLATAEKLGKNLSEALGILSLAAAIQPNSSLLFAETVKLQLKANLETGFEAVETDESPNLMKLAIETHRRELEIRPERPELYYRQGILMMSVGAIDEARQLFEGVLRLNPSYARARCKLAICLFEAGEKEKALKQLSRPKQYRPDELELHYKTALLYCDKVKFAASVLNLELNMENNFTKTDAIGNISIVLQNLGLLDRAEVMWDNLGDTVSAAVRGKRLFPDDF